MTLEELVNEYHETLNENDLYIINYITCNLVECSQKTVSEIAKSTNISSSSIIRMVQKLGFQGYGEFRYFLKSELQRMKRINVVNSIKIGSSVVLEDVKSTIRLFEENKSIEKIYHLMSHSRRIFAYSTGYGQSLIVKEFARCLVNIGLNLIIIHDYDELRLISSTMDADDLLFVISSSGNIGKIKVELQTVRLKNVTIVSLTRFLQNDLAHLADFSLYYEISNINAGSGLNSTSFCTLLLVLTLLYEGYIHYMQLK